MAVSSGDIQLFTSASVTGGAGINPDSPSLETGGSADVFVLSVFKFALDAVSGRVSAGSTTCASNYIPPRYQICSKHGDYGDFSGQMFSRARAKLSNPKIFGRCVRTRRAQLRSMFATNLRAAVNATPPFVGHM